MAYPAWTNDTERKVLDFFQTVASASAAEALRAVPEAKRRHINRLHGRGALVSAPSAGRANMLRVETGLAQRVQGQEP